jgi:hypothetical protein
VTSVDEVALDSITDDDARRAGAGSIGDVLTMLAYRPDKPVYRIGLRYAGDDPRVALRADDDLSVEGRAELVRRLERLDRSSPRGPWTAAVLDIIGRRPAVRAADLAVELGRDLVTFKRDVRKLKELGLTESLEVGYRLAPRAIALGRDGPD